MKQHNKKKWRLNMLKSVIKEIIILLLLSVAILLILMVLFYDYIPISEEIPTVQAYTTPEDVRKDEEGMQTMRILGRNMAYYLKCIEAGREKGINPPEQEKITFTNFIR